MSTFKPKFKRPKNLKNKKVIKIKVTPKKQ